MGRQGTACAGVATRLPLPCHTDRRPLVPPQPAAGRRRRLRARRCRLRHGRSRAAARPAAPAPAGRNHPAAPAAVPGHHRRRPVGAGLRSGHRHLGRAERRPLRAAAGPLLHAAAWTWPTAARGAKCSACVTLRQAERPALSRSGGRRRGGRPGRPAPAARRRAACCGPARATPAPNQPPALREARLDGSHVREFEVPPHLQFAVAPGSGPRDNHDLRRPGADARRRTAWVAMEGAAGAGRPASRASARAGGPCRITAFDVASGRAVRQIAYLPDADPACAAAAGRLRRTTASARS